MIRQRAIKGVRWSSVAVVTGNLLQFVQLAIVSRFISSTDYGLMAITLVVIYFAQLLGDMGISNALIYKKQVSRIAFSSLFWISLGLCWILFCTLFLLAPVLGALFRESLLPRVIRLTSVSFIFLPLHMQYLSLLKKELHFDKIAAADIVSRLVSLLLAVILAMKGMGVFSLVYSSLAALVCSTVLYAWWGSRQMRIRFVFKLSEVKEFLHFGMYQTGNELLNYLNFQADTLLLGHLLGTSAVGYYAFAKNLAVKPTQVTNPVATQVAYPVMAKMNHDIHTIKIIYLKMLGLLSSLNFLVYPFIAASAQQLIRAFFDDKWLPAANVLQALAFYCMIRSVFNPIGALLSSRGMVKKLFYWNLLLICIIPAIIYCLAASGIVWVVAGMTAVLIIFFIPLWKYLILPATHAGLADVWRCIRIPLLNAFLLYAILNLFNLFPWDTPVLQFAASLLLWLISGFLLTYLLNKKVYAGIVEIVRGR